MARREALVHLSAQARIQAIYAFREDDHTLRNAAYVMPKVFRHDVEMAPGFGGGVPHFLAECPEIPANGPELLVQGPELPSESSELLLKGPEVLAHGPEVLAHGPEVLAHGPEVLAKGAEILVQGSEVLAEGSEFATHIVAKGAQDLLEVSASLGAHGATLASARIYFKCAASDTALY